jgi:butyrate kinase
MGIQSGDPITVLAVNPGSTSTKVAIFSGSSLLKTWNIEHDKAALDALVTIKGQLSYRIEAIRAALSERPESFPKLSAIVGRGGLLHPMEGGVYEISDILVEDALNRPVAQHAANLGCAIAYELAKEHAIPSFIVDPVCTDEYEPEAKISGLPMVPRVSLLHALSCRASGRRAASELGISFEEARFVVAHMGGGTTICSLRCGRLIDANNSNDEGPFTPERSGTLPTGSVAELAFSGEYSKSQLKDLFLRKAGLFGYLGTNDAREVIRRIAEGDAIALEVMQAMAYQTAKEIGAYAAVLSFELDALIITGGLANWSMFVEEIMKYTSFLGKTIVYPGENEMQALAEGAILALKGLLPIKKY